MKKSIDSVPIASIRILNPRHRDKKKFAVVVESIKELGLKKPIKISRNEDEASSPTPYDLICGQGRIEAFLALGYEVIPAEIVSVPKEDRLLMSLVENMARRFPRPADLMAEIERLKALGYSNRIVGTKLGIDDARVSEYVTLKKRGEERLLNAALNGTVSVGVAIEIAMADTVQEQRALLKAYQEKQLTKNAIRTVRRLIEERRLLGKGRSARGVPSKRSLTSAEGMVKAYTHETERMRDMVRKARICDEKTVFLTNAFGILLTDRNFVRLLGSEKTLDMPEFFRSQITASKKAKP